MMLQGCKEKLVFSKDESFELLPEERDWSKRGLEAEAVGRRA